MKHFYTYLMMLMLITYSVSTSANSFTESRKLETEFISVYPNPFNTDLSLRFSTPLSGQLGVKVFDVIGNVVFSNSFEISKPSREIAIALDEDKVFSKGIYIVRVSFAGNNYSYRIYKQ